MKLKRQRVRKKSGRGGSGKLYFFLIIALVVIVVGSLAGWLILAKGEVSFEEAMKKPELRDSYIEKVVKEIGKPEYVTVVNYEDTSEEMEFLKEEHGYIPLWGKLMALNGPEVRLDQLGKQTFPVRISILPFAFSGEVIKTEADFISSLLHEYHHAENFQKGKIDSLEIFRSFLTVDGFWNEGLFVDIDEMDAILMELATQTKISQEYRANRMGRYLEHYTNIWDHEEVMDPKFIEFLKVEFFESWFLESLDLFKEWQNGKEIWYFKHPKTGREYHLSEEIIRRFKQNGKG